MCSTTKKYPDGQFIVLAKAECPDILTEHIPAPVAEVVPTPAASVAASAPVPVVTEESAPVTPPVGEWQTIDRYQVKEGLVKDTVTGLMWMRCSLGQEWNSSMCAGEAIKYTREDAMKQKGSEYGGFNDWRVPTHEELKKLVFCSREKIKAIGDGRWLCDGEYTQPTINKNVFPNTPFDDWFWSASRFATDGWLVGFDNGLDAMYAGVYSTAYVRLVRSEQ